MSFTLSFLLIPYFLFLLIFLVFTFFNLYHILRFGFRTKLSIFMISMFCIGTIIILIVSFGVILQIDWNQMTTIGT
ncbi:hypothetical protein K8R61_00855 [bacterium]|nr:hypothetical protein [bacterium]